MQKTLTIIVSALLLTLAIWPVAAQEATPGCIFPNQFFTTGEEQSACDYGNPPVPYTEQDEYKPVWMACGGESYVYGLVDPSEPKIGSILMIDAVETEDGFSFESLAGSGLQHPCTFDEALLVTYNPESKSHNGLMGEQPFGFRAGWQVRTVTGVQVIDWNSVNFDQADLTFNRFDVDPQNSVLIMPNGEIIELVEGLEIGEDEIIEAQSNPLIPSSVAPATVFLGCDGFAIEELTDETISLEAFPREVGYIISRTGGSWVFPCDQWEEQFGLLVYEQTTYDGQIAEVQWEFHMVTKVEVKNGIVLANTTGTLISSIGINPNNSAVVMPDGSVYALHEGSNWPAQ